MREEHIERLKKTTARIKADLERIDAEIKKLFSEKPKRPDKPQRGDKNSN